jgi:hypothetical protein
VCFTKGSHLGLCTPKAPTVEKAIRACVMGPGGDAMATEEGDRRGVTMTAPHVDRRDGREGDRTHTRTRTQSQPREEERGRRGVGEEGARVWRDQGRDTHARPNIYTAHSFYTRTHTTRACAHARAHTHGQVLTSPVPPSLHPSLFFFLKRVHHGSQVSNAPILLLPCLYLA